DHLLDMAQVAGILVDNDPFPLPPKGGRAEPDQHLRNIPDSFRQTGGALPPLWLILEKAVVFPEHRPASAGVADINLRPRRFKGADVGLRQLFGLLPHSLVGVQGPATALVLRDDHLPPRLPKQFDSQAV